MSMKPIQHGRWWTSPRALLSALLIAAAPGSARAAPLEPYEPTAFIRSIPALPPGTGAPAARRMSLNDAVVLAVQSNLGIALSREELAISRSNIRLSEGGFEPLLRAVVRHTDTDAPPSTLQEGAGGEVLNVVTDSWSLGYEQRLRLGTSVGVNWDSGRSNSNLRSAVSPLLYNSRLELRLTQPLLQGFGFDLDVPYAEVLRAELDSERARQAVVGTLSATLRDTEQAYWALFQALKSYEVQLASLSLAREQVTLTQRQIDAGVRPPYDLINAEGTVAERELRLIQAEAGIDSAADRLRFLLNLPKESWAEPLLPTDPPSFRELGVTLETALRTAIARRPELRERQLEVERAALDVRVAQNQRLPRLDAELRYGWVGQNPAYEDTLEQLVTREAPGWSALMSFTWTPLNRAANARFDALQGSARSARLALEQQLASLHFELQNALRGIDTAERSLRAAARVRELAERSLDAEERKYQSGDGSSSSFFIAQRQDDLARAQLDELSALIQHQQAATLLQATMGVLLDERGVKLDVRE